MSFLMKKVKSLGGSWRQFKYEDQVGILCSVHLHRSLPLCVLISIFSSNQDESWLRGGIFIGVIILFILAVIGVFIFKYANPPLVSGKHQNPSVEKVKELQKENQNGDISQLSCSCGQVIYPPSMGRYCLI